MRDGKSRSGLIREPLLHFLIIGALVFSVHALWSRSQADTERTISISAQQVQRLTTIWASEAGREPNADDVKGLLAEYIREEVLYREALQLGLDRDDTIIRRRLAQKMGFVVAQDEAGPPLTEADLRAAFEANTDAYARPPRVSFVHVPFNFARDGGSRQEEIKSALNALQTEDNGADWTRLGDAFLLSRTHVELTEVELGRLFGRQFASQVFALEGSGWAGPLRSRLATHLVRIDARIAGGIPDFEEISETVRTRVTQERIRTANEAAMAELRARYTILINGDEN